MPPIGVTSFIIGVFSQAILYGFYIATFIHCVRYLVYIEEGWKIRSWGNIRWLLLTISIILFAFSTVDIMATLCMVLTISPARVFKFDVVTGAMEKATMLISDAILIYRCWVVYTRSWRVICVPLWILWFSNLILVSLITYHSTVRLNPVKSNPLHLSGVKFEVIFYACNLATNSFATCAIVYRLRKVGLYATGRLFNTSRVFLEAGILYTSTSFMMFVISISARSATVAGLLCDSINFSTAGITFNFFIIRMNQFDASGTEVYSNMPTSNE